MPRAYRRPPFSEAQAAAVNRRRRACVSSPESGGCRYARGITMKKNHILALSVAIALASAAAHAQTAAAAPAAKARIQLDANKDGVIDRAEAAKAPKLAEKFDQLDRNKDGKLDAGERPDRRMRHRGAGRDVARGGMMRADTDKDGR